MDEETLRQIVREAVFDALSDIFAKDRAASESPDDAEDHYRELGQEVRRLKTLNMAYAMQINRVGAFGPSCNYDKKTVAEIKTNTDRIP